MKISKNILTSALAVIFTLSVITGTFLYANQYTSTHASKNDSFQNGNKRMPRGDFQEKDGSKFQNGPPDGDFMKPQN